MADVNVSAKKFLAHEVCGNKRMDLLEFVCTDEGTGSILETRLSRIEAFDICAQDSSKRDISAVIPNSPGGGKFVISSYPASTTGVKFIVEAWGW